MAAQPESIETEVKLLVDVDVSRARQHIRRGLSELQQANRELAQLQEHLDTLGGRLAKYGIRLEVRT